MVLYKYLEFSDLIDWFSGVLKVVKIRRQYTVLVSIVHNHNFFILRLMIDTTFTSHFPIP